MFDEKIEKKTIRAVAHTASGLKVEGSIFVHKDIRLIDEMNRPDRAFLAISEAVVTASSRAPSDDGATRCDFIILNKQQINCIAPLHNEAHNPEGGSAQFNVEDCIGGDERAHASGERRKAPGGLGLVPQSSE